MNDLTPSHVSRTAATRNELIIVEDSRTFARIVESRIRNDTGIRCTSVRTLKEARALLAAEPERFGLALVDLCLPDATNGEAAVLMVESGVPTVVFTGIFDEDTRSRYLDLGILDFVLKDNPSSLDYIVRLAKRVFRNRETTVLIVDDSRVARRVCTDFLRRYCLDVLEASSADEALAHLSDRPDIRLVITDHEMPGKSGFDLVRAIRETHPPQDLAIIGVSGATSRTLSAKFLKYGANDFVSKPYVPEELYTRVAMNLELQENLETLTWAATHDALTGMYNRRAFLDFGKKLSAVRSRADRPCAVAILDIDHFKRINDTHGHDAGDAVLQAVATCIEKHASRVDDVCARFGGEEFAIMAGVKDVSRAEPYFEELRRNISELVIRHGGKDISVTVSIGLLVGCSSDLHMMLAAADRNLYKAKNAGRNQVRGDKLDLD